MSNDGGMKYRRFLAMIATSTAAMLGLMYLNTYAWEHVFWSETRFWMAFVMGATMAVIMLSFMLGMYKDPKKNAAIFIGSVIVFAGALWLVRSQQTIDDVAYMKAMIPHHSIAIMTSERAHIRDPRTRELAKAIITAQRREIAEMRYLIAQIEEHEVRTKASLEPPAPAADLASASATLEGVATALLHPEIMTDADVRNAPRDGGGCTFRFTRVGFPVFLYGGDTGLIKLNGRLISLPVRGDGVYEEGGVQVGVRPLDRPAEDGSFAAELVLRFQDARNELGFHGVSAC